MTIFSWLSAWMAPRKAKAYSFGDVAAFRGFVMAALRNQPGVVSVVADLSDPAKFKIMKGDGASTGDVTNIFGYINAYSSMISGNPSRGVFQAMR